VVNDRGVVTGRPGKGDDMKVRVVVDRIEEELAILEVEGEGWVDWPVKFLPRGTGEGSILDVEFRLNKKAETKQRTKIRKLQRELLDRTRSE